ncbi:hypothetical protein PENTCL1PPCAC_13490, partial [Pristionchus entomophagus]
LSLDRSLLSLLHPLSLLGDRSRRYLGDLEQRGGELRSRRGSELRRNIIAPPLIPVALPSVVAAKRTRAPTIESRRRRGFPLAGRRRGHSRLLRGNSFLGAVAAGPVGARIRGRGVTALPGRRQFGTRHLENTGAIATISSDQASK